MSISDLVRDNKTTKDQKDNIIKKNMSVDSELDVNLNEPPVEKLYTDEEPKKNTKKEKIEEPTLNKKEESTQTPKAEKESGESKPKEIETMIERIVKSIFTTISSESNSKTQNISNTSNTFSSILSTLSPKNIFNTAKNFITGEGDNNFSSIIKNISKTISSPSKILNTISNSLFPSSENTTNSLGITNTNSTGTQNTNINNITNNVRDGITVPAKTMKTLTSPASAVPNSAAKNLELPSNTQEIKNEMVQPKLDQALVPPSNTMTQTSSKIQEILKSNTEMIQQIQFKDATRKVDTNIKNTKAKFNSSSRLGSTPNITSPTGSKSRLKPSSVTGKNFINYFGMQSMSLPTWRIRNG